MTRLSYSAVKSEENITKTVVIANNESVMAKK